MANVDPASKSAAGALADANKFMVNQSSVWYTVAWSAIKSAFLGTVNAWTKAQSGTPVTLTVAANAVAVDLSLANNFSLALQATTGQTLSEPSNIVVGQSGAIAITQNANASTLAYHAFWDFNGTAPAVSTASGAIDVLAYYVVSATKARCTLVKE